jgi:peptidoglycan DL-endopeptidase CwlO
MFVLYSTTLVQYIHMKLPKIKIKIQRAILIALVAVLGFGAMPVHVVSADTYDEQIKALQGEISQFQIEAANLRSQANTLQNEVNALQAERNALQIQIDKNQVELDKINADITTTEKRIDNQRKLLADNLHSTYIDGSITPIEILASSNSISNFIDKQEYRNKIQQNISLTLKKVRDLRQHLSDQKKAAERTLADQKAQHDTLAAKESQQAQLLADTQGQEATYQQLSSQKNSQIASLRAAQAAANTKWGGNVSYQPRGGGYPSYWNDIPMDSTIDNWGMYNRECVSYTAFKVAASGRYMPYWGGRGNAIQWPGNARAMGLSVDGSPKAGDVAVWPVGYYGHVMYVESVGGDGSIYISEYNYDWSGRYSERSVSSGTWHAQGFQFIHF